MNHKIDSYIHALFAGIPRTKKAQELKEELLSNMHDRYADYLREGKSDAQAYSLTVASMGDVEAMIAAVTPDEAFRREAQFFRRRNARNTAVSVAIYILGAALVVASALSSSERLQILAVVALLVLAELVMVAGYFVTEWLLLGYGLAAAAGAVVPNLVQGFSGVVLGAMLIPLLRRVTPSAMRL